MKKSLEFYKYPDQEKLQSISSSNCLLHEKVVDLITKLNLTEITTEKKKKEFSSTSGFQPDIFATNPSLGACPKTDSENRNDHHKCITFPQMKEKLSDLVPSNCIATNRCEMLNYAQQKQEQYLYHLHCKEMEESSKKRKKVLSSQKRKRQENISSLVDSEERQRKRQRRRKKRLIDLNNCSGQGIIQDDCSITPTSSQLYTSSSSTTPESSPLPSSKLPLAQRDSGKLAAVLLPTFANHDQEHVNKENMMHPKQIQGKQSSTSFVHPSLLKSQIPNITRQVTFEELCSIYTLPQLRAFCRENQLKVTGSKITLATRIIHHLARDCKLLRTSPFLNRRRKRMIDQQRSHHKHSGGYDGEIDSSNYSTTDNDDEEEDIQHLLPHTGMAFCNWPILTSPLHNSSCIFYLFPSHISTSFAPPPRIINSKKAKALLSAQK